MVSEPHSPAGAASTQLWSAPVAEVGPYDVGVHRSRSSSGVGAPTPYVQRDADAWLRARVRLASAKGGVVLIVGRAAVGKSRAAWNMVSTELAGRQVIVPTVGADLGGMLERFEHGSGAAGAVVWLDDLDQHVTANENLNAVLVFRLALAGAVVVATTRHHPDDVGEMSEPLPVATARHVLHGVHPVRLHPLWSSAELDRGRDVAARTGDTDLAAAVDRQVRGGAHGVTAELSAAPELVAEWHGDGTDTDETSGLGRRLVAAAVDLARVGMAPFDTGLLHAAAAHYGVPADLTPDLRADALRWATQARHGVGGLLLADAGDHLRPFDYLVDVTTAPLPPELWTTALDTARRGWEYVSLGKHAYDAERHDVAAVVWQQGAEAGTVPAMHLLGALHHEQGDWEQAEHWLRAAAGTGDPNAMYSLGVYCVEACDTAVMRTPGGLPEASQRLAQESARWIVQASDKLYPSAILTASEVLIADGDLDRAKYKLSPAARAGNAEAMRMLGAVLYEMGRPGEAESWYRAAVDAGDTAVFAPLGLLLEERRKPEEAERLLRAAAEHGVTNAMTALGNILIRRRRADEAMPWLRGAAEAGDVSAMCLLGAAYVDLGTTDEAERWLRGAAERGDTPAMKYLARLLRKLRRRDEAKYWKQRAKGVG